MNGQDPYQPDDEQHRPDTPSASPQRSPRTDGAPESPQGDEPYMLVAEKIFGTAMMFIGFLNVLLSISGGYEISIIPFILYFGGMAVWAHATIPNLTVRYTVMAAAIVAALGFYHYGDVLFWHKQVVFWGTVLLVGFFMFKSSPS